MYNKIMYNKYHKIFVDNTIRNIENGKQVKTFL